MGSGGLAEAEAGRLARSATTWPAFERLLPGLFPPRQAGIQGTERRIAIALLLAVVAAGTISDLSASTTFPLITIQAGWLLVLFAAIVPWHRLPRIAFGVVALGVAGLVALLTFQTGGATSPYSGLFYLAVMTGCVVAPPLWSAVLVGALIALFNALPLSYAPVSTPDEILVRSGLLLAAAAFGSWLIDELSRVVVVASLDRRRLGEEREVAAELRRTQMMRQEYMSVVAHELRNPLVAIGTAARVVAKDLGGKPSESIANGIVVEVKHALELLDGLTDVSSLEAGRLRIVLRPTELTGLVKSVLPGIAPDHRVVIRGSDAPVTVLADEGRIGQVLRNLVGNAAKYAPVGTLIEVTVGHSADRRSAVISVRDEGPGIPPLERERLFERFSRLSTAGGTRGSGLGLYISRGIIRDHQGDLTADWPSGGGTVFTFTLPLAEDAATGRTN